MKSLAVLLALASCGSPIVAVVVAVMRASDAAIDAAVKALVAGVFLVLASVAVRIVTEGLASHRQAQFPAPSHQIDNRRQQIDARHIVLVNGSGEQMPLPAGYSLMEVDR